jgi:plastocyanin
MYKYIRDVSRRKIMKKNILSILAVISISALFISIGFATIVNVTAQLGSMATLQNIPATYAVSIIPGAAQRESPYHYYPSTVAVPVGTTIAWFNNDFGQPHTVTSGLPNDSDAGTIFNSGVMPATANSFFQYTFDRAGDFAYHCIIHPWRVATVSASDSFARDTNFKLSYGTGPVWDLNKDFRTLLNFEPLTVPLDRTTPINYNITIYKNGTNADNKVFSDTFVTAGEQLPLELIRGSNETISYGPDFSSTGAYHVEAPFFKDSANYTIRAEIAQINAKPPDNPIVDEFSLQTFA